MRKMKNTFFDNKESIQYLSDRVNLLDKFYLAVFDSLNILDGKSSTTISYLKEIHQIPEGSKVQVEDLQTIIKNLKLLLNELNEFYPAMPLLSDIYDHLKGIIDNSQNLLFSRQFLSDANIGLLGTSDTVSESQFSYDQFYVFNEQKFEELINHLTEFMKLIEKEGITEYSKNKSYKKLTDNLQDMISIVLFIDEKFMPNCMFFFPPKIFEACVEVSKGIRQIMKRMSSVYNLISIAELVDDAIKGLQELKKVYKGKPKKKIKINGLLFVKDEVKEFEQILEKTSQYL
ncbi:MAG: hypothetical protein GF308_10795 [Candidatus Heimdallarchaeota archaeon]|nr:hypothetical protein [Candidatus Heimdallarchaeota archaeon]